LGRRSKASSSLESRRPKRRRRIVWPGPRDAAGATDAAALAVSIPGPVYRK
jgi:hypothetical protein